MNALPYKIAGTLAALCLAGVGSAVATPAATTTFQNGSFADGADGLAHWHGFGDVVVFGARRTATMTTASLDFQDDEPLPEGFNNRSGIPAVDFFFATTLAGVPLGNLDIGGISFEGSALRQDFIATGGGVVTVSFDWTFLTTEPSGLPLGQPDFGFVALNGAVHSFIGTGTPFATGRFQHTFVDAAHLLPLFPGSTLYTPRAGQQVSLVFGVVDVNDVLRTSELRVDNIAVSAVPEPEAFAMLATGLGLIGWKLRRRQKSAAG